MEGAQKLTPLDASFLHLETPRTHMHIGGVAIFDPSPLGTGRALYDGLVKVIEPRLDLMTRYRQKLAFVPLSLDVPVWVDDPEFDMRRHLVRAALPKPGGDHELQELIGRIFSRPLDRRRPLWEMTVVEGLPDGRWALVTKTHHAMVDGISGVELFTVLLDVEATPRKQPFGVSRWEAREAPSSLSLFVESLRGRVMRPARLFSAARAIAGQPARLGSALKDTASGLMEMLPNMGSARSAINGVTGPGRVFTYSRFPLDDFKLIKNTFGGTINDAVLAVVTGGLRNFLLARGVDPEDPGEALQALCPVSIRDTSEQTALGNRLAMLLVKLPIEDGDVSKRVARVRKTVDRLKERKQAVGADFLLNLAGFAPSTLHAMVARASLRQINFNLIVTNVPGPQIPLYLHGAQMREVFPVAFLYDGQEVAVAIFSYLGQLNFGYLVDSLGIPDADVFAQCIEEGMRELVDAAREVAAAAATGQGAAAVKRVRPAPRATRRGARKPAESAASRTTPARRRRATPATPAEPAPAEPTATARRRAGTRRKAS